MTEERLESYLGAKEIQHVWMTHHYLLSVPMHIVEKENKTKRRLLPLYVVFFDVSSSSNIRL